MDRRSELVLTLSSDTIRIEITTVFRFGLVWVGLLLLCAYYRWAQPPSLLPESVLFSRLFFARKHGRHAAQIYNRHEYYQSLIGGVHTTIVAKVRGCVLHFVLDGYHTGYSIQVIR